MQEIKKPIKPASEHTSLIVLIIIIIILFFLSSNKLSVSSVSSLLNHPTPTPDVKKAQDQLTKEVLPKAMPLGISFGDSIVKMVEYGAIDKTKFMPLYEGNKEEAANFLEKASDEQLIITEKNAGLLLNLLWPLGLSNQTRVLSEGPMGTQYKSEVGDFASTGGWTLGKQDGGRLFNTFNLITLTSDQENTASEIAQNIYRPCCDNSTYFPDCNHGAAMLGFIELAVKSGMPKEEIYKKALVLNSYWFPQSYVELAIYFKLKKGIDWKNVNAQEILSKRYSSASGYMEINKILQDEGIVPKVEGGTSC